MDEATVKMDSAVTAAIAGMNWFNLVILVLSIGVVFWVIRQFLTEKMEKAKLWKIVLRTGPSILGGLFALIPALSVINGNLVHSIAIGCICGPIAQSCYGIVREVAPQKFRAWLGSRAKRVTKVSEPVQAKPVVADDENTCPECGQPLEG